MGRVNVSFDGDSFIAGTSLLTAEERGIYVTLLCLQWGNKNRIAATVEDLAHACRASSVDIVVKVLASKFVEIEKGVYQNKRASIEYQRAQELEVPDYVPPLAKIEEKPKSSMQKTSRRGSKKSYSKEFGEWWEAYWCKSGKHTASEKYERAISFLMREKEKERRECVDWLLEYTKRVDKILAADSYQRKLHGATFLNQKRFLDPIESWEGEKSQRRSGSPAVPSDDTMQSWNPYGNYNE